MYSRARLRVAEHQQKGNGSPGKTSSRLATQSAHFSDLTQSRGASVPAVVPTPALSESVNFPRVSFIKSLWNFATRVRRSACRRHAPRRQQAEMRVVATANMLAPTANNRVHIWRPTQCTCISTLLRRGLSLSPHPSMLPRPPPLRSTPGVHSACGPGKALGDVYTYTHTYIHTYV